MLNPYRTIPVTILDKKTLFEGEVWLKLDYRLDFKPGQFIEISLPGFGESPVAPCSDPIDNKFVEIVVRDVGSLTRAINSLAVGDKIHLRGPYGNGWPLKKLLHHDLIILAGGTGIIPLRPLLFNIINNPKKYGKIYLLLGAKDPQSHIFRDNFAVWKKKFFHFKTIVDQAPNNYLGLKGVITDLLKPLKLNPKKTVALMCGPEVMCPFCVESLEQKSIPSDRIFISLERRMKCGLGLCQHCNCGKYLVCQDGPIFDWETIKDELRR